MTVGAQTTTIDMDASCVVGALMQRYHKQLATASDVQAAAAAILAVYSLLIKRPDGDSMNSGDMNALAQLPAPLRQLLEQHVHVHGWRLLRATFFMHHFDAWAAAAFAGMPHLEESVC